MLDVEVLKASHAERKTDLGKKITSAKNSNKILPIKIILDILRDCFFGKPFSKIILVNLGSKMDLYESVEHELFELGLLEIEFEKKGEFKCRKD